MNKKELAKGVYQEVSKHVYFGNWRIFASVLSMFIQKALIFKIRHPVHCCSAFAVNHLS